MLAVSAIPTNPPKSSPAEWPYGDCLTETSLQFVSGPTYSAEGRISRPVRRCST
jgi:hypothetical protein